LLIAVAMTASAGALGGGAYTFLKWRGEGPVAERKGQGPVAERKGEGPVAEIKAIAAQSSVANFPWFGRGRAPAGYIKGMALVYARVYRKLKSGNAAALDMAKANTGDVEHDALAYYNDIFADAGMPNSESGADTLRHLFVLLIGLGMRVSSGRYCQGFDLSVNNIVPTAAEAGLFGSTYASMAASPLLIQLFISYLASPSGFVDVFGEGVRCSSANFENNVGGGDIAKFQRLSKECPAFAVEYAAVGLRHIRHHWSAIDRRQTAIPLEGEVMLSQVQAYVDASPAVELDAALL
jgi:hypothetical protein